MKKGKIIDSQQLSHIVKKFNIRLGPFSINTDGTIDVYGNVKICHTNLHKLPLKFGKVHGDFICSTNQLTTLKGTPKIINGNFNCYGNKLSNLKYCPVEVGGHFFAHQNNLISLEGSPKIINGNFTCFLNNLTSLLGGPMKVTGDYFAYQNNLTSLEGSPDVVGGEFNCCGNKLVNLKDCPKSIGTFLFDESVTSLYTGNVNCDFKRVQIKKNKKTLSRDKIMEQVIFTHQKKLQIVLKYNRLLDIWDDKGNFNESNFNDIILDIEEGLR